MLFKVLVGGFYETPGVDPRRRRHPATQPAPRPGRRASRHHRVLPRSARRRYRRHRPGTVAGGWPFPAAVARFGKWRCRRRRALAGGVAIWRGCSSGRAEMLVRDPLSPIWLPEGTSRAPGPAVSSAAAGEAVPAHLLQLVAGLHLLGEEGGLDPVEQLPPASLMSWALGSRSSLSERKRWRRRTARARRPSSSLRSGDTASPSSLDGGLVDLLEPGAAGLVEGAWRTSSSSCFTIEPMRMTLAGWSTDSRSARPREARQPALRRGCLAGRRAVSAARRW